MPMHVQNEVAIAAILEAPAVPESGRHADIRDRSLQLKANGMDEQSIYDSLIQIYPIGSGTHRRITEKEVRSLIRGAAKLNLEPTPNRRSKRTPDAPAARIKRYEHDGSTEELPDEIPTSPYEFVHGILGFKDEEYIWFAKDDFRHSETLEEERFLRQHDDPIKVGDLKDGRPNSHWTWQEMLAWYPHGTYFAINPLASRRSRTEDNVSRYLYTLIEGDDSPREQQLAIFSQKRSADSFTCR